ncbi:MAG: hypothetical protein JSS02_33375 [Planctomycetes bacterium]|nr:hypothetical protein [Planctomycetota bacterium]
MMTTPLKTLLVAGLLLTGMSRLPAGELTVSIEPAERVASIGVVRRFGEDGQLLRPVDPKATFAAPYRDAKSESAPATFRDLPAGTYDVIVFLKDGTRLEGFHMPVFDELDETGPEAFSQPSSEEVQTEIRRLIKAGRYYENQVTPLFIRGNDEHARVLVQLVRDEPTSLDAEFGAPVASVRYELWQFTNRFGTWSRDRKSKILHRVLEAKAQLHKRRWLWTNTLGGIRLTADRLVQRVTFQIPERWTDLPGLQPE